MTKKTISRLEWATPEQQRNALTMINAHNQDVAALCDKLKITAQMPAYVWRYEYAERKLFALNAILETHGLEFIRLSKDDKHYSVYKDVIAAYLNVGDAYIPTVVYREDTIKHWDILVWGDLVEILERKHYKLF